MSNKVNINNGNSKKILNIDEIKKELKKLGSCDTNSDLIYNRVLEYINKSAIYINKNEQLDYNNLYISNTVSGDLSIILVEILNNLIQEYNCNTTLEKTLCEVISNSYGKIMSISRKLNENLDFKYLSKDRNEYIGILSKELDRANRIYITSLNNLIEIKRPAMNIKINTKNAYLGGNQQFNNNKIKDENIKA